MSDERWERECNPIQLDLSGPALEQVGKLTGGQTTNFNPVQLFWLAMEGEAAYGEHAYDVYIALRKAGHWMCPHTSSWWSVYHRLLAEKREREQQETGK